MLTPVFYVLLRTLATRGRAEAPTPEQQARAALAAPIVTPHEGI